MGIFRSGKHSSRMEGTILSPNTPFAFKEAYKTLRTNMEFVSLNGQYKKIIITSALPNEGKSTIAINLAISMAETGAKVLLVDCDMRNPSVHRYLQVKNKSGTGLSTYLAGKSELQKIILDLPEHDFQFVPAGIIPPNPAELLGMGQMQSFFEMVEKQFDYIICDTPPVSVVSDAAILSRFCDGVLLVIKQRFATKEQVRMAKKSLDAVEANIIGAVLEQYDITEDSKDGRGRYSYYRKYNYGYYQNNTGGK